MPGYREDGPLYGTHGALRLHAPPGDKRRDARGRAALEQAVALIPGDGRRSSPVPAIDYPAGFARLVDELSSGAAVAGIAGAIELESDIYDARGLVTYVADEYLLDIISDTTERTPTFMIRHSARWTIPRLRPRGHS